ncbi:MULTISPECIES: response regulator [Neptunomonas]|uniref:response regulator n=1 Tax=Neptunomonas TaxID=75687 RepID=UPI001F0C0A41|nr:MULTISPECIES: response regulator [Neptunomonas]
MEIDLPADPSAGVILEALRSCSVGDALCLHSETAFQKAKILVVKEQLTGVSIQLLDEDGYIKRQVVGKHRNEIEEGDFNDRQMAVIRALEKVLSHCKREGVRLVGYSDELVAYPASFSDLSQASVYAFDIDTDGVYTGADSELKLVDN